MLEQRLSPRGPIAARRFFALWIAFDNVQFFLDPAYFVVLQMDMIVSCSPSPDTAFSKCSVIALLEISLTDIQWYPVSIPYRGEDVIAFFVGIAGS